MSENIISSVRTKKPLVQCITNFVTVNDCANIILACGGTPTMAHDVREVEEIAAVADALVFNIGTVENTEAMLLAGKRANELGTPVVLDPVAAGASRLRIDTCRRLLEGVKFTAIRGNISEIKALCNQKSATRGVDAGESDAVTEQNAAEICRMAQRLSQDTGAVIAISGKLDIVADAKSSCIISNGCEMMSRITGSGCMLTSVAGAFCGAERENAFEAVTAAVAAMGLCGERALTKTLASNAGTASFRMFLIDEMSLITDEILKGGEKIEIR